MMIHAYQEMYVHRAQSALGDAFDYAVNVCGLQGSEFSGMFSMSTACKRMEHGEPLYLTGKSGIEIMIEVVEEMTGHVLDVEPESRFQRSPEYWIGWAVAYYQWYSDRKFREIFEAASFDQLLMMYPTLHEADVSKFTDIMNSRMKQLFQETRLKRFRAYCGLTQAYLSKQSGVSLRSIQMYEQRNKDINKASADTLYRLAKILRCSMEDLIEK